MTALSSNLKTWLTKENISENELSRRTGVSQQVINRLLSGENTNPKIATLRPLAHYFHLTLSQLLGEEEIGTASFVTPDAPFIAWNMLQHTDCFDKTGLSLFSTRLHDQSMEPKFTTDMLLIFDRSKVPTTGDFVLLKTSDEHLFLRQCFKKNQHMHAKCLNPNHPDYTMKPWSPDTLAIATLIQSRMDFASS